METKKYFSAEGKEYISKEEVRIFKCEYSGPCSEPEAVKKLAGDRLDELTTDLLLKSAHLTYKDAFDHISQKHKELYRQYIYGEIDQTLVKSAGEEVDEKVKEFCQEHKCSYSVGLNAVLGKNKDLARRYVDEG